MRSKELLVEFYDPSDDQLGTSQYDDTRRPRLTMRHLNKMRKAKDAQRVDDASYLNFVPSMYSPAEDEGGPDF